MSESGTIDRQLDPLSDSAFKDKLASVLPQLRAFARSLCGNPDTADDLVQETMLKAWSARERFVAGTNFRAWTFTILRNHYFSLTRRGKFTGEWDDLIADRLLAAPAGQDMCVTLRDMMRALMQLPDAQREALILVGAGSISYEEAAQIMDVAIGTVKSRVARARVSLEALMEGGQLASSRAHYASDDPAIVSIFAYLEQIQTRKTGGHAALLVEYAHAA